VILDDLAVPVVLAPLAGGPSTPELACAVSEAGGLGFLASGYLSAPDTRARIERMREMTPRAFGVNVFAPPTGPTDPAAYEGYLEGLRAWAGARGLPLGEPRYSDDEFDEKIDLLVADSVPVVSFTFGCPAEALSRVRAAGSEVWVTVTSPEEAAHAVAAGADALVVQGAEAGGHRGSFVDRHDLPVYRLLHLLGLIASAHDTPLVAAGGLADGAAVAAALAAGARAAQAGTAFLLCPEAGTSAVHREAIRSTRGTVLTRAFTGRLARGIENAFIQEHETAPLAYPELHYVTAPLRQAGRERGDADLVNLWAGEAHAQAREAPAAEVVRGLSP
jgi:nitronate monooxygenase